MVEAGNRNVSVIFHLGLDRRHGRKYEMIRSEHKTYGDILQNNLLDSYQNLTCELLSYFLGYKYNIFNFSEK